MKINAWPGVNKITKGGVQQSPRLPDPTGSANQVGQHRFVKYGMSGGDSSERVYRAGAQDVCSISRKRALRKVQPGWTFG